MATECTRIIIPGRRLRESGDGSGCRNYYTGLVRSSALCLEYFMKFCSFWSLDRWLYYNYYYKKYSYNLWKIIQLFLNVNTPYFSYNSNYIYNKFIPGTIFIFHINIRHYIIFKLSSITYLYPVLFPSQRSIPGTTSILNNWR